MARSSNNDTTAQVVRKVRKLVTNPSLFFYDFFRKRVESSDTGPAPAPAPRYVILTAPTPSELRTALYDAGRRQLSAGNFRQAEYHLWEMVRLAPTAPTSTYALGVSILFQGRYADGRRLVERAYALRPSVNDSFDAPGKAALLRDLIDAQPDWAWPAYQLLRDRFEVDRERIVATYEHCVAFRSVQGLHLDDAAPAGQLETELSSDVDVVSIPFRTLPLERRTALARHLDDSGFACVFGSDELVAVRTGLLSQRAELSAAAGVEHP